MSIPINLLNNVRWTYSVFQWSLQQPFREDTRESPGDLKSRASSSFNIKIRWKTLPVSALIELALVSTIRQALIRLFNKLRISRYPNANGMANKIAPVKVTFTIRQLWFTTVRSHTTAHHDAISWYHDSENDSEMACYDSIAIQWIVSWYASLISLIHTNAQAAWPDDPVCWSSAICRSHSFRISGLGTPVKSWPSLGFSVVSYDFRWSWRLIFSLRSIPGRLFGDLSAYSELRTLKVPFWKFLSKSSFSRNFWDVLFWRSDMPH